MYLFPVSYEKKKKRKLKLIIKYNVQLAQITFKINPYAKSDKRGEYRADILLT